MPSVDVLIPTYNQATVVEATVRSALEQDYDDLRVVVSDDGSTDGTVEVLREVAAGAGARMSLVLGDQNRGIPVNFNRLVDAQRADLIAWLGGDDLMLPGKIRAQVALLEAHPEAVGVMHDAEIVDAASGARLGRFSEQVNGAPGLRAGGVEVFLDPFYMTLPSTLMVRRAAGSHRYDERLRFANDWLWTVEAFTHGSCAVSDEVLVEYRQTGTNVTAAPGAATRGFEESMMAMALVAARHPTLTGRARAVRAALLVGEARRELRAGERHAATEHLMASLSEAGPVGVARLAAWGARAAVRRTR